MGKSDVNQQGSGTAICFRPDEDAAGFVQSFFQGDKIELF